jgi:hypothetical protein
LVKEPAEQVETVVTQAPQVLMAVLAVLLGSKVVLTDVAAHVATQVAAGMAAVAAVVIVTDVVA